MTHAYQNACNLAWSPYHHVCRPWHVCVCSTARDVRVCGCVGVARARAQTQTQAQAHVQIMRTQTQMQTARRHRRHRRRRAAWRVMAFVVDADAFCCILVVGPCTNRNPCKLLRHSSLECTLPMASQYRLAPGGPAAPQSPQPVILEL